MGKGTKRLSLQICRNNQMARRPEILERLRQTGWSVDVEECLDQCTRCDLHALALAEGQILVAKSPEEMAQALRGMSLKAGAKRGAGPC